MVHAFASLGFLFVAAGAASVIAMMLMSYRVAILAALGVSSSEQPQRIVERRIRVSSVRPAVTMARVQQRRAA